MRQFFYFILLFGFFFLMLLFPEASISGAKTGLLLWFETLLPTLLPFIIFSNILIKTGCASKLSRILHPIFRPLFQVSSDGCFAIIVGFLCGYPMGAKVINDLLLSKRITKNEAAYLLSFCNNTSPMFIIGFVISKCFSDQTLLLLSLSILYGGPLLCSILFRIKYRISSSLQPKQDKTYIHLSFDIFDSSIMTGFESITKIGGYMMLFSILFYMLKPFEITYFLPFLEITNGIPYFIESNYPFIISYPLVMASVSFGGLCALAQTKSMIQDSGLSILSYTKEKLITAMVTSLMSFLYAIILR